MLSKRLISLCAKSKKYIWFSVAAKWLALICNIAIISSAAYIVGAVFGGKTINFGVIILLLAASIAIRFACHIFDVRFSSKASLKARHKLRSMLFDKLLCLGISYTRHCKTADIVQTAGEGIETLDNYFGRYMPQFFYAMLAPITLFAALSFISLKTALVLLVCVPLIPLSIVMFMKIAKRIMRKYWGNYTDLAGSFLENLQGLCELKLFSADGKRHKKLNNEAEGFRRTTMKVLSMQLNSITIMDIIAYGGAAAGSIVALLELQAGQISIGGFITIVLLSAEFFLPLRLLGSFFHITTTGVAASEKIFALLDIEEETAEANELIAQINCVTIKNLTFGYTNDTHVLKNINMKIHKNEFAAIAGESGSGKSKIAALLTKMRHCPKDSMFYNNTDVCSISNTSLLKHVHLLSTDSYIFSGTIRENLLMSKPDATENQMKDALKQAQLLNFVLSQPKMLDTSTGEEGSLLSGGQRQRLALARAILADRQIMIFDEATSNVDSESEDLIWKAIHSLKGSRTIITISHRLVNIRHADHIYMMKDGRVVEHGSHKTLLAKQGEYAEMLEAQRELESYRGKAS